MDFELLLLCRQLARNYLEKDRIYQEEAKKYVVIFFFFFFFFL